MQNLIGKTIAKRYRVDEFLGRGGMAEVYKVWDTHRGVHLAMKLLHEDLAQDVVFLRRFRREANTLSKLQHPHIVRFYGLEQDDFLAFMLTDFIDGETLKKEIFRYRGKGISVQRGVEIIAPVCSALSYAHRQGLIHCDIKPGNIMIDHSRKVFLADFGISRMADSATATMVGAGTPAYMSPEQVKGLDPIPQTDVYALGVIMYEMFTGGERPFTGEQATSTGTTSAKVRWEQVNLPPPSPRKFNPGLTSEIEQVIFTCLEKDSRDRYQTPLELLNALAQANQGIIAPVKVQKPQIDDVKLVIKQDSVTPLAPQTPEPVYQPQDPIKSAPSNRRRGGVWIGLAGMAILVLGIMFGARLSGSTREPQQQSPKSASDQQSIDTPVQQQVSPIPEIRIIEEAEEPEVAEEAAEEAMGEKIPLTLYYMPVTRFYYPNPKEIGEAMAADLANAGFDVQLELAGDWPTYLGLRREGNLDGLYQLGWGGDNGDPDNFLYYFFGFAGDDKVGDDPAAWVKSPEKREGWYANTDVAYLLYQASITPDQAEREAMYNQVENLLHDDVARLWVAHNNTPLVFSSSVSGYVPQPVGADYFEGVVVEGSDTFVFGRGGDSVGLDPAVVTDGESFRVTGQVLEPLYQYEPGSTKPIPALAESCTANAESTEWVCALRQGVKFHDGTDFNADAVVFNFDRQRLTAHAQHYESQTYVYYEYMLGGFDENSIISAVEKVDDYTVKFVLSQPLAPFLANLAMDILAISSPAAMEAAGEDYGLPSNGAVGTGPFKFVEWVEGDHITVEANADYWGGAPTVDEIVFRVIADDSARFLALQAGDIQGFEQAVVEDLVTAEAAADLYVMTRPALNTGYLAFSYKIVEFQDVRVREALAHAINRQGLIENFYGAYGEAATNFLPPRIWGHDDTIVDWEYNPELSRELLAEAGFPDGLSEVTIDPAFVTE